MRAVLVLAAILVATPAGAETAPRKFLRGLAGMTTAFLEVPGNMVAETNARGAAQGLPLGFAEGLGMIVPRVLVGVYEFLSAPFEFPAGYRPILRPEFPWGYFEGQPGEMTSSPPAPATPPRASPSRPHHTQPPSD